MVIKTRDFGELTVDSAEIIHFKSPIYGFEEYTDFAMLSDENLGSNIVWLQSTQLSELCFILVDPKIADSKYNPVLSPELLKGLENKGITLPVIWAIAVIPQEFRNSTVNLKSPVLIDPLTKSAAQVILDDDYSIRAPLVPAEKGDKAIC